jgi:hypothetical protein
VPKTPRASNLSKLPIYHTGTRRMGRVDEGIGWNWYGSEEGAAAVGCFGESEVR